MSNLFLYTYRFFQKFKILGLSVLIAIIIVASYFTFKLKFSEDISRVLPDSKNIDNMSFVFENSKLLDKLLINISFADSVENKSRLELLKFSEEFSKTLESKLIPDYLKSIEKAPGNSEIQATYDFIIDHLPVFLETDDIAKIDSSLSENEIQKTIDANYKLLVGPAGFATKKNIKTDPLHFSNYALNKLKKFNIDDNFEIENGLIITKDGKDVLLMATPLSNSNTRLNENLFTELDSLIINAENQGFTITYFGNSAVTFGNAQRIKKDIIITVSLAFLLLLIFISLFFKKKSSFILVFLPVIFGALMALGFMGIFIGEVSAIALGIGSVLLGISVDYAIHILSHFRQNSDKSILFRDVATPIVLSSLTTSSAFLSLLFINSKALNDLGVFAAISVFSAALFSLIILPHLIKNKKTKNVQSRNNLIDKLAGLELHKNNYLKISIVLITIVLWFTSSKVNFDADMMKNNYMSDVLKQAENKLNEITSASLKTIYIASVGRNLDAALHRNIEVSSSIDSLEKIGVIKNYTSVSSLLKSQHEQEQLIESWENLWQQKYDSTTYKIKKLAVNKGFKANAFAGFDSLVLKKYQPLDPNIKNAIFSKITSNYLIETDTLTAVINVLKLEGNNETINQVYNTFDGKNNVWVVDRRLITSELMDVLNDNFNKLIIISLALVFIILLLAYGRIELTIITMIPVLISWIWTVGIMGIFGISFNIFNIIILTFIFGLGIDYSIFMMRGLLQDYKYGIKDISSYRVSIILSSITTLAGIGVLIFAKHPALKSIALMSIIGIFSVVVVNFILLPAIFKWLVSYKKGLRNRPVTLLDFIMSLSSLIVFVAGALFMTLLSFVFRIIPANRDKKKYVFHFIFSKLTWFLIYMNIFSRKTIINPLGEDYSEASIVIANHQSHIDLMLMMLLNPKVVVLTNKNNYNHPFYGYALKYADFLPSDGGYENVLKLYKPIMEKGYSLVIYPEGHRNDSGIIKRFHKGAFYLAEKLNIPVQPILIHGQNQLLKKSEFFLKRGSITTKFLPKIYLDKNDYGEDLRSKTKGIQKYFKKQYADLRKENETPDYFADYVRKNYLYKGPVLEWYTFIKLKLENNYKIFNEIIPRSCKITDLGCGYGYLDYMLNLVSDERVISAVDYDEQKIMVAANCAIKTDKVKFITASITEYEIENSDVIILKDVLHYLPQKKQNAVLENCYNKLNDNGIIIIRDGDAEAEKEHKKTRITEWLSTGIGFNKTTNKLEFISETQIRDFASSYNLKFEIVEQASITSNKIYMLRR